MATIDYKQLATPEANLIELLSAQNQDGTYTAKLMGSEPFAVLAAKTIYNAYNDIEDNMAADVEGPASSTDNALARFDGTTGKLLQNSNAILTDAGALSLASNLTVSGMGTSAFSGAIKARSGGADEVGVGPYGTGTGGIYFGNGTVSLFNDANTQLKSLVGLSLAGNLTVSGTGTSSVAGSLSVNTVAGGNPTVTSTLQLTSPAVTETGAGGLEFKADVSNNGYGFRTLPVFNGVSSYDLYTQSRSNSASWTTRMSLTNSGNLLLGTTIDGGQKLQVNGTIRSGSGSGETLSAGSIDVGADIGIASTQGIVQGGSRIVTFTSGNATFAGKVGIGVSPASWELNLQQSAVNSAVRIISPTALGLNDSSIYIAWASGSKAMISASYESTGSYKPLVLSTGGVDSLTLDTSGNATFAGKVYVGSTKFEFVHNGSQGDIQTYSSTPLYINRQGNIINFGAATLSMDPASGNMTMNGGLMTGAPSGGTANRWKFGSRVAATTTLDTTQYLQVDIGGTLYKVALVTS